MRVALLGDVAFFGRMSVNENPDVKSYFSEIADYLKGFDYVVGNLETPFSRKKKTYGAKSAYICADVENIELLRYLHIDAVTLANNHVFDYGKEGYETTKELLKEAGIEWFGAEGKDLHVEKAGGRLSFAGYCCYTSNPLRCVKQGEYGVNAYNLKDAEAFISRSSADGYLPILAVHAGMEHVNYPAIEHVRAARQLAKAGSYVYYGHHPHVIQGVEDSNGSLIAHSLGNFCFDDVYTEKSSQPLVELTENNRTGAILELDVEGGKLAGWRERVFYIAKEGKLKLVDEPASITEYNERLANCEEDSEAYTARRKRILAARMSERKSARNLMWYLKRLKPRYVKIILNARNNAKEFNNNVLRYIER